MPATRPRASFEPISPTLDLKKLVESTPNFSYVDRISASMIDRQGIGAFEKLVLLHVVIGGKPLVIDGFEDRLDPWTFSPKWLRDNCGAKVENARVLNSQENLPLTMGHYLKNMGRLTNQFFEKDNAYKEKSRQRVYLKDIDCPGVWEDKLKENIPSFTFYLNESTGEIGGPGAPDPKSKGIARAGDLMSSLPPDMRAENLMCYIGHEGTYTPSHREMCASLGQNIMVEASTTVSEDGKPEKPGSSVWFMTETKDRHIVSEYWLSVLGHDIEVENHFAQIVAWKKAPFNVYVLEQKPGDYVLIPPLAPHQVWNRGTRTIKVAWNRTTVETLEMALNEALPRSRIVCRDEQYKNKAIVYYTLQKYSGLLAMAKAQADRLPTELANQLMYTGKVKQLFKDFKRLFNLYRQILLSEMFNPEDRDAPKSIEYLPFDSNVTCAYCRGNIFNRFLSCQSCKDLLGHHADDADGDPYDVCMDCYAMGRSCACISNLRWVEQFRWKELASKYEGWRKLIVKLDGGVTEKTPLSLVEERRRYGKKTLAEVCKEQLKRRPFKDVHKSSNEPKDEDEEEEIVVDDNGMVKKIAKKPSKAFLKNNTPCHVCCKRHPNWKMAFCTTCDRAWCYGSLYRGWDKMPMETMEDPDWACPHCLGICFAGNCRREGKMQPYEPKGTLLGHDTKKIADVRSVEALVDFSISNLNWLKDDNAVDRTNSNRVKRAKAEADRAKRNGPDLDDDEHAIDQTQVDYEYSPENGTPIEPAISGDNSDIARLDGEDDDAYLARRLQHENSAIPRPAHMAANARADDPLDGYAPVAPPATMYPLPGASSSYPYPEYARPSSVHPADDEDNEEVDGIRPFRKRARPDDDDEEFEDSISMQKHPKAKKPRMSGAGFRSTDLAEGATAAAKAKTEAQRQFEKEKERKALDKAKAEGRFIMLQAALRNKKRIVKLKVPGARLAQLLAQQAARAALGNGEDADADHEVEEGAQQSDSDHDGPDALLKSDIQVRKPPNPSNNYQERKEKGLIVTSKTKKALIPVEKDENYGFKIRERLPGGKRVVVTEEKRKKGRKRDVEYEEVDIGSDEDDQDDQDDGLFVADNRVRVATAATARNRRSLPGYLQTRQANGDEDFPNELPENFRDSNPNDRKAHMKKASRVQAVEVSSGPSNSQTDRGHTGGKRPSMRPASVARDEHSAHVDDHDADAEADKVVNAAVNGEFMDIDETPLAPFAAINATTNGTPHSSAASASQAPKRSKPSTGRPRGRPSKSVPKGFPTRPHNDLEEQNRLAKLQALEMFGDDLGQADLDPSARGGGARGGSKLVSMADALPDDDESDGTDAVPARRSTAMAS